MDTLLDIIELNEQYFQEVKSCLAIIELQDDYYQISKEEMRYLSKFLQMYMRLRNLIVLTPQTDSLEAVCDISDLYFEGE